MHNTFITKHFDWSSGGSRKLRLANAALARLGFGARLTAPGSTGYMTSVEQRMNLYHLVSQVLAYGVPGAFVELGTFTGETAVLIGTVMQGESEGRDLHVYDSFEPLWNNPTPRATLAQNFQSHGLPQPVVHAGLFDTTIPKELPAQVAFVNIDCGCGGDPKQHADLITWCLEQVYPRMPKGAICSLIDYKDVPVAGEAWSENPGVKPGADRFLKDKPERISVLYAGDFAQAYFRKL